MARSKYFTHESRNILEAWYQKHKAHPYATEQQAQHLATSTGLAKTQVMKWLSNRRYRTSNTRECCGGGLKGRGGLGGGASTSCTPADQQQAQSQEEEAALNME